MDRPPLAGPGRNATDLNTPPARPLLALQADAKLQERIRLALRLGHASRILAPPVFTSSWRELADLGAGHPGSPALVDPGFLGDGDPNDSASCWASPRHWARTPLIRYSAAAAGPGKRELTRGEGLHFVASVRVGQEDELNAIDAAILGCTDMRRARSLLARLAQTADPYTHRAFGRILELATGAPTVAEVAARVGEQPIGHSTAAAPPCGSHRPRQIVSLARIFTVERLSAWSGQPCPAPCLSRSASRTARTTGDSSDEPSGHRLQPSANLGGADYVAEVIVARLSGEQGDKGLQGLAGQVIVPGPTPTGYLRRKQVKYGTPPFVS